MVLRALLEERFGNHPHVGEIRGRGYFVGLELVADRATKAPFDPSLALHRRVKEAAMQAGLICYPTGGTIDGRAGDRVLGQSPLGFAPSVATLGAATPGDAPCRYPASC